MTDEERKEHIKELDKDIEKMRKERNEYQEQLLNEKRNNKIEERKRLIGKCFIQKTGIDNVGNNNKEIKAFKILELLDEPNEDYAKCLVLYSGLSDNCWNEFSIKIKVLGLWTKNITRLMHRESDLDVIDFYNEISNEKFEVLFDDYLRDLEKYLWE
jgi:hypothetical protein